MRAVLLDIEGTTTPVAFVRDTLVPYARRELRAFLEEQAETPAVRSIVSAFHQEHSREAAAPDLPAWKEETTGQAHESVIRYAAWLMDRDRKSTALKTLQGLIWQRGYSSGELVAPVYDDVPSALRRWQELRVRAGIFSSGSVLAQQLLFRHSSAGDLTPCLHWHFDTTVGAKMDAGSYRRIASAIGTPPSEILFVSDSVPELDAARATGMQTVLCHRPGEADPGDSHGHDVVASFDEFVGRGL